MSPLLLAILGYLVLQFGIGVWASKRVRSESDYLLAGRSLGYPLATFSFFATWFGAETVMGSAGTAYSQGASLANAEPFGYGLCLVGMGFIFARPLWRRQLTTLADLFRTRYAVSVERVAAVILIPSSILWAAAQVRAFGQVLSLAGAFELEAAIALATGFTIMYTVFGGLLADAVTDLVQGAIVILGLVVVAVAVVLALPEGTSVAGVLTAPGAITIRPPADVSWLALIEEWSIPVCGSLIATELVGRVVATRSEHVASRAALLAGGMYIVVGLIPLLIGLVGRQVVAPLADAEQVVPAVAQQLLPPVLFVVFVGGLLSAILSTVDSTLLVASGLLSHNLVVPVFRISDERQKVRVARLAVASFGLLAFVLAVRAEGVFALVEQASAFGSSGALVVVVFGLFTPWGGARTAMVTLLVGLGSYLAGAFGGFEAPFVTSLLLSLLIYVAGSAVEGRRARVPVTER
ncbi:MAG: sodium:solute symporter family protein [Gemmatimonadetes bacterium]|nr:sodium:solute symporter family protein [Gemmatimonadota bacterium]